MSKINVGIIGVGNCAKSLIEGAALYRATKRVEGLAFPSIGGYVAGDLRFVLAYDVDRRKVGLPLSQAILSEPNCAMSLYEDTSAVCGTTYVKRGHTLDGIASHMQDDAGFLVSTQEEPTLDEVVKEIKAAGVQVLVLYLPVGSQEATEFYVNAALHAGVPFVNCIPVFIVSNPAWEERIREAGIPAIGDDMRSQVGASVLSQILQEMFLRRGTKVKFHCQQNSGGNTDFRNMLDKSRLASKKTSKENVITSQNDLHGAVTPPNGVHAGPSDYIPYLKDNKVCHIRIEAEIFGGAPVTFDCRLSVQDSPNSAGVVIDAVRYVQVAKELGIVGPLRGASAFTQKTPPLQMTLDRAYEECRSLAERRIPGKV